MLQNYSDNDDIQGAAAVTLGALLGAVSVTGKSLKDQQVVFPGAGSAIGVADHDELRQRVIGTQWTPQYPKFA